MREYEENEDERGIPSSFFFFVKENPFNILEMLKEKNEISNLKYLEDETSFEFWDARFSCTAHVTVWDNGNFFIKTAWGHVVYSFSSHNAGASVCFAGPFCELMGQDFLPELTYLPKSLYGRSWDQWGLLPINEVQGLRRQQVVGGEKINRVFNNEISFLPKWEERKIEVEVEECMA